MASATIDIETWERAPQFRLFRPYARPHYAVTVRQDVTRLIEIRKPQGVSVYRACLFAIGAGLDAVPALKQSFEGDVVTQHDAVSMSMTVPRPDGTYGLGYLPFDASFDRFDKMAQQRIARVRDDTDFQPFAAVEGAVAYVSCLPWFDFTSLDQAVRDAEDCIPRVACGKIVPEGDRWRMAMSVQVHHALVDGAHLGPFFDTVQATLNEV